MARESLLHGTSYATLSRERRAEALETARQQRRDAFAELLIALEYQAEAISEGHPKELDAINAEIAFLTQFREMIEGRGEEIIAHFTNGHAAQQQLEAVRGELATSERQVGELRSVQEQLRDSAREASDLRGEVSDLTAKLITAEKEAEELETKVDDLEAEKSKPNPLTEANQRLTTENTRIRNDLNAEKEAHQATKEQLRLALADKAEAKQPSDPPTVATSGEPEEPAKKQRPGRSSVRRDRTSN